MKISEVICESSSGGSTGAGSIATVNRPMGGMVRRGVYGEGGNYGEAPPELKRSIQKDRIERKKRKKSKKQINKSK